LEEPARRVNPIGLRVLHGSESNHEAMEEIFPLAQTSISIYFPFKVPKVSRWDKHCNSGSRTVDLRHQTGYFISEAWV
jgi:hypothetical protein